MNKVVVIGLDGAPYHLITRWTESGDLPNLAKLISSGCSSVLRSTIPVHSPTAWSSFITGLNPGKHGVYDFVKREQASYQLRVIRANQIQGASLWNILSKNGRSVGVMNVPMTYPPEEVNGYLISGLGTPDYVNYTYPPELCEELDAKGYRLNKAFFFDPAQIDRWLNDIHEVSEIRGRTAVNLIKEKPTDFFMAVFRNTDEICHFFWHYMDKDHPRHDPFAKNRYKNAILELYKLIDHWVGEIVSAAGSDANVFIMSDHGAGPLYKDVFINEWLWKNGWLKLIRKSESHKAFARTTRRLGLTRERISKGLTKYHLHRAEVLIKQLLGDRILLLPRDERVEFATAIDWSKTKAYSFGYYGQIFINLRGREPEGIIDPGDEYEAIRQAITNKLYEITDPSDGQPVVDRVYRKEELFRGPHLGDAPDLLAIMRGFTYITRKGYEFAEKRGTLFREPYTDESGSHRIEGILIGSGPDILSKQQLADHNIHDLTPTILHLMQCPIPTNMDGHLIEDLFKPNFLSLNPIQYTVELEAGRTDSDDHWNEKAEAEIYERLKNLGYLG